MSTGKSSKYQFGQRLTPLMTNIRYTITNVASCSEKRNNFDATTDTGETSLGKYTLPNNEAFVWNVFDTAVRHSEKYSHRQIPLK